MAIGFRVSCRTQLLTSGFHGYLRTTLVGSEAGAVAPEVGLGDMEEASSLEDRWAGGQEDFFSLPPWAEGPEDGQGYFSRRQCDLLCAGQGTGQGKGSCPLASQLIPSSASPFSGGRGGTEETVRGSRAREGQHPLS